MGTMIINIAGIALIGLIVWWFWLSKPKVLRVEKVVDVLVDAGTYTPSRIEVPAGEKVTLRFLRKDPSPCAEKVIFDDFGISADLHVDQVREIELTPDKPGEYAFACQMQMYRGSLVAT